MQNLKNELIKLENDFNNLKKKIERFHLLFLLIFFSLITLTIIIFQKYFTDLYNIIFIRILLFSLMIFGLLIHFFLRYKFYKNKNFYKNFFNAKLNEIYKNFSNKENFNKLIVDYIKTALKNEESQISKADLHKINFWGLLLEKYNIDPDKIVNDI